VLRCPLALTYSVDVDNSTAAATLFAIRSTTGWYKLASATGGTCLQGPLPASLHASPPLRYQH
jgi:hypothetical protein